VLPAESTPGKRARSVQRHCARCPTEWKPATESPYFVAIVPIGETAGRCRTSTRRPCWRMSHHTSPIPRLRAVRREDFATEIAAQLLQFIHRRLKRRSAHDTYQRGRFDMRCVELAFQAFRTAVPVPERFVRDPGLLCTFVSAGSAGVHLRAWHSRREESGTWETPRVPELKRRSDTTVRRACGY